MEKEILTLENFDEKALKLLKKENYDSLDIKVYYQPDEMELDSDTIRKVWDKKEKIKAETFEEVLSEEIYNNWGVTDSFDISEEYIVNNVLKKYIEYPIESEEYEKINEEKIKNSKFLSSLKEELENNGSSYSNIVFTKANCNLSEAIHLYNSQENLVIPKEGIYCGFVGVINGDGSLLEIELEKEIIINKENFKIITDFGDKEGYSVSELYNFNSKTPETFFKEIKEKGFEQHEINIDNVLENAKKYFEIDNELDNSKVIEIK